MNFFFLLVSFNIHKNGLLFKKNLATVLLAKGRWTLVQCGGDVPYYPHMSEWVLHILIFSINLAKTENFWAICSFSNSLMIRHSINCPLCWNSTNGCAAVSTEFPRNWKFRGEPKSLHHLLFSSILRTFHTFFADSSIFLFLMRFVIRNIQEWVKLSMMKIRLYFFGTFKNTLFE